MRVPNRSLDHFTHSERDAAAYERVHGDPGPDPREPDRAERHAPPPPRADSAAVSLEEWLLRCEAQATR